jgi:hypothetical protein
MVNSPGGGFTDKATGLLPHSEALRTGSQLALLAGPQVSILEFPVSISDEKGHGIHYS